MPFDLNSLGLASHVFKIYLVHVHSPEDSSSNSHSPSPCSNLKIMSGLAMQRPVNRKWHGHGPRSLSFRTPDRGGRCIFHDLSKERAYLNLTFGVLTTHALPRALN